MNTHAEGKEVLQSEFYNQPCLDLAKNLLGKLLCRKTQDGEVMKGRIVETESYLTGCRGKALLQEVPPGCSFIYGIYGIYNCFNISSKEVASCVLIRSLEPTSGLHLMKENRSARRKDGGAKLKTTNLCSGPSKLCQALQIGKDLNRSKLFASNCLWLEEGEEVAEKEVVVSTRVGTKDKKPFRFYEMGNKNVSVRDRKVEAEMKIPSTTL